jgi:outer membrane protein OmpA-like peptidoglycan-associated protein
MDRSQLLRLLAGAGACGIAGTVYIHGPIGARKFEDEIDRAVSQSLALAGHGWAHAEVSGQHVSLTGASPTEAEKAQASQAILTALGPGGALFGAVANVDARSVEIVPAPTSRAEFRLRLIKRAAIITAFGDTAGEPMNVLLRDAFPDMAGDLATDLNRDAFEDAEDWTPAIGSAAHALALLEEGSLSVEGQKLSLQGKASTQQIADLARGFLAAVTPFFDATVEIEAPPAVADAGPNFEDCVARLATAVEAAPLVFGPQSSRLPPDSQTEIALYADALAPCDAFGVIIEAHSDQTGAPRANLTLSQRRADALASALREAGVKSLIESRGMGEFSPWIAIERSESDRAANRRVDIRLIRPIASTESE